MDYKKLFENLFDAVESAAWEDEEHDGYKQRILNILPKYATQRGKGEEYEKIVEEHRRHCGDDGFWDSGVDN